MSCCECGADCYHGDLFFECAQCEDTCQECAESKWEQCDFCGDLQCPNCLDVGNEECKSWPTKEETLDDFGRETDAYAIVYDCCGDQAYEGDIDGLQLYDTVCPSCYYSLGYEVTTNIKRARKEHHATRFWCNACEEYGCDLEPCACGKEGKKETRIMKWRMNNEGATKTVGGEMWYWCPEERLEGIYDGLYMSERGRTADEGENHEGASTNEEAEEKSKEEESEILEESKEDEASSQNEERVANITTMMSAVRTDEAHLE